MRAFFGLLLILATACRDSGNTLTESRLRYPGLYHLVRVNGSPMPFSYPDGYPGSTTTITDWQLILREDGWAGASVSATSTGLAPYTDTYSGSWRDSADVVLLKVRPEGIARLTADTIRVDANDGRVYAFSRLR